jgi:hypothetical protein
LSYFTLVIMPTGKALLVSEATLPEADLERVREAWKAWKTGHEDVLFVSGTKVVLVEDIELDLTKGETMTDQEATATEEPAEDAAAEEATEEAAEESAEEAGEEAAEEGGES